MYVKKRCMCPFHYDLLFVPPFDSSVNFAWQHYYVFISYFGNVHYIFNVTNGRKLWILFLSKADLHCKTTYPAEGRKTLGNKGYAKYREPGPRMRDKHKNSLLYSSDDGGGGREAGFLSLGSKSEHQICSHCLWNLWNTLFFMFFKTLFMCLLAALHSIWDPSSSTRDQIGAPYIGNKKS